MCGRYLLDDEAYADILQILHDLNAAKERTSMDNVSNLETLAMSGFVRGEVLPASIAPVITNGEIVAIKWGFPHWKNSGVLINARAETALEKRMFGKPLKERRCVIPSGGFFEWSRHNDLEDRGKRKPKDKYLFRRPGEHTLYMAGMESTFRDALGEEYSAFIILTTAANDFVSNIHDRMPVILASDEIDPWINDNGFMEYVLHRPGPELTSVLEGARDSTDYEQLSF